MNEASGVCATEKVERSQCGSLLIYIRTVDLQVLGNLMTTLVLICEINQVVNGQTDLEDVYQCYIILIVMYLVQLTRLIMSIGL